MSRFLSKRIASSRRSSVWFQMSKQKRWFVYIVECNDGTLYTGVTTDVDRRLHEHNFSKKGAKYTRARRPVILIACRIVSSKSEALKLEHQVKKQNKHKKIKFLTEHK